ncbi:reelin domain-containing protein 1-like [Narcine bancroftii]|uniref:reelin domain-containing protein 1-like n=1 Tax=Narcine bancroftii TaxID=1343680 RepID=UPI00383194E1
MVSGITQLFILGNALDISPKSIQTAANEQSMTKAPRWLYICFHLHQWITVKLLRGQEVLQAWMIGSLCLIPFTCGFSHGASPSACADMKPKHISAHSQDPRSSFITVHTNGSTYLPGDQVPVTVRSARDFMGFLIQARRVTDDQVAGTFILISSGSKLLKCFEDGDTVTHSDKSLKRNLSFVWKAPDQLTGDIKFFVSAVQSYFIYWSRIESGLISDQTKNDSMLTKNEELMETLQASVKDNNTMARMTIFSEDFISPQSITQMRQEFSQTLQTTKEQSFRSQATYVDNNLPKVDHSLASEQSTLVLGENDSLLQPSMNSIDRRKMTALLSTANSFLLKTLELTATESNNILNTENEFNLLSLSSLNCSNIEQINGASMVLVKENLAKIKAQGTSKGVDSMSAQDDSTFWFASFTTGEEKDYKNYAGKTTLLGTGPFPTIEDINPTGTIKPVMAHRASANFLQSSKKSGFKVNSGKIVRNTSVRVTQPVQKENGPGGGGDGPAQGAELAIPQLGILLGCSAALGMALAVGMRHFFSQHCRKHTEVSFRDPDTSIMGVGDSGELVHVRKIRENSFVLVQAEYNVINPPITVGK